MPGEPATQQFDVPDAGGNVLCQLAFGNYVGMGGTYEVSGYPDTDNGVLIRNRGFRITDIYDGSSNTIMMVSEHGIRRKKKGYTLGMLIEEVHFLEQAVYDLVQKNWGMLDITILISELSGFQKGLHAIRQRIAEPFARTKKAAKA